MTCRTVVLVGPRASGKSTVGRALAARLGWRLVDGDEELAACVGEAAGEHLRRVGEVRFREVEERVSVPLLDAEEPSVVSLGGGAVLSSRLRERLAQKDLWTAFLCAPAADLVQRMQTSTVDRPPLTAAEPEVEVRDLLVARLPLYREVADASFDTGTATVDEVVDAIVTGLA